MSWLSKIKALLNLKSHADKLIELLKGKKTYIGTISMLIWFFIYGVPVFFPEYAFLAEFALRIQSYLADLGLILDKELLGAGAGITVIGFLDKIRRMLSEDGKD